MRYVVGLMMVAFLLGGVGLFAYGVRELVRRFAARGRLRPAEGEIVRIEVRTESTGSDSSRTAEYHYPEIRFRPGRGGEMTFLSEIGAGARAKRYAVGQKIGVLYDPDGEIPPMIDSWAGMWFPHLVRTIVGPLFIAAAAFIYFAFGDRIFGE
jgi:hypothetical protein